MTNLRTYNLARLREELEIAHIQVNYLRQDFNHYGDEYKEDLLAAVAHKQALRDELHRRRSRKR